MNIRSIGKRSCCRKNYLVSYSGNHKKSSVIHTAFVVMLVFILALQPSICTAALLPGGSFFEYTLKREVGSGEGEYEYYSDSLTSEGRYDILSVNQTETVFHAKYSWRYSDSEGRRMTGAEDRVASCSLQTRLYTSSRTELDDYDNKNASGLAMWFWIDTNIAVGETVQLLDDNCKVISCDTTVWSNWLPKKCIALEAEGKGERNDEYGNFSYTYTVTYYFEKDTGFIVAERYVEKDTGFWQNRWAAFEIKEYFDVTKTSYQIETDYLSLVSVIITVILIFLLIGFLIYAARWRRRKLKVTPLGDVRIMRVRKLRKFPHLKCEATNYFTHYIEDFANKALLARDRLAVAISSDALVGFAVYNRKAKIGTILCRYSEVTETLRKYVGVKDFFSEVRHQVPENIQKELASWGTRLSNLNVYNVFETYQVLRLDNIAARGYDTQLISRMTEKDMPEIENISRKVYRVKSKQWLRAQLLSGDVGFVARINGKIVGFAFATYANGHGRIHTLTVLPNYRNRGVGKELMCARLKTLYDLGARSVITEIADWNLASLQIAYSCGFKPVGTMYVETARSTRIKKTIVRR